MRKVDTRRLSPEVRDALAKFATGETGASPRIYQALGGNGARVGIAGACLLVFSFAAKGVIYGAEGEAVLRLSLLAAVGCLAYAVVGWIVRLVWPTDAVNGIYFTAAGAFELNGRVVTVYEPAEVGQPQIGATKFKQGAQVVETLTALTMTALGRSWKWGWRNQGAPFEGWLNALNAGRAHLARALEAGDATTAMTLDPLIVCRVTGQWEQPSPLPAGARFRTPPREMLVVGQVLAMLAAPALLHYGQQAYQQDVADTRRGAEVAVAEQRLRLMREASARHLAQHPNAPGARLVDALTRSATDSFVTMRFEFTGGYCGSDPLCDPYDPAQSQQTQGVEQALGQDLTSIFQSVVPTGPYRVLSAHVFHRQAGDVGPSEIAVRMERARDNALVPDARPVIRWRFTGVLQDGATQVPLDFTFVPATDPPTAAAARRMAQYQTAMRAFTRQYLAPLFGVDLVGVPVPAALQPLP